MAKTTVQSPFLYMVIQLSQQRIFPQYLWDIYCDNGPQKIVVLPNGTSTQVKSLKEYLYQNNWLVLRPC